MNHLLAFQKWSWLLMMMMMLSLLAINTSIALNNNDNNPPPYKLKAVNLGAWLVAEGWMTPHLFQGIPNNDLLDGTQVRIKCTSLNMYLSAENGGGSTLLANRPTACDWETFRLWRINENTFNFRAFNVNERFFIGLSSFKTGRKAFARETIPSEKETFVIVRSNNDPLRVRIRASNGLYLWARNGDQSVWAEYDGDISDWGDHPSVFRIEIIGSLQGEYQLTNGYGPDRARFIMREHWNTYITEDDFRFMSEKGLNAVRIPVGWWIMHGDTPPEPFVGGSLQALDNAFKWAESYNMKVIVDLHAAPGSQNGHDNSSPRDGYLEWGVSHIQDTVNVIDFLAQRYANLSSLAAIQLLNEPWAPGVNLDDLKNYYRRGYNAVRKYTSTAYVILSNRLGNGVSNTELVNFARDFSRSVIDIHYYNIYEDYFKHMDAQQNIQYIYNNRTPTLEEVTQPNGALSFVGEWTGFAAGLETAGIQDYQDYTKAQMDVYDKATFGWAYWSYKCVQEKWSLKWMIENKYIKLQ